MLEVVWLRNAVEKAGCKNGCLQMGYCKNSGPFLRGRNESCRRGHHRKMRGKKEEDTSRWIRNGLEGILKIHIHNVVKAFHISGVRVALGSARSQWQYCCNANIQ